MRCSNCSEIIDDDEVRWAFEDPYCQDCFDNGFNYCSRCDEVIARSEVQYDDDSNPYCSECYENQFDDDAPDNPEVSDLDRNLIVQIARKWLRGEVEYRRPIKINEKDKYLKKIRDQVGLVDVPLYLFGLRDRDDYQISATQDLIEDVREFCLLNNLPVKVEETEGAYRIGVSLSLRQQHQGKIVSLLKELTRLKVLA